MTVVNGTTIRKRKRGISASRIKLEKAMLNAGFKTQAALAEKIAQLENTDNVPKDLVNRVFREKSVSPSSIERIAYALEVEAFTLYKTQKESGRLSVNTIDDSYTLQTNTAEENVEPASQFYRTHLGKQNSLILLFSVLLIFAFWFGYSLSQANSDVIKDEQTEVTELFPELNKNLGKISMTIQHHAELVEFISLIKKGIDSKVNLTSEVSSALPAIFDKSPHEIASDYQVDFVLSFEVKKRGRYQAVNAYLYSVKSSSFVWSKLSTVAEFNSLVELNAQSLTQSIESAVGLSEIKIPIPNVEPAIQDYYLEGRELLDDSQNQQSVKDAQSRFTNIISLSPQFAQAHAGLCESYLLESWTTNEKLMLEKASKACGEALRLAPDIDYVVAAESFLLRKTGRINKAISILEKQLDKSPNNLYLYYSLAFTLFEAHYQFPNESSHLTKAKRYAQAAIHLEQTFWKPYFVLSIIEWAAKNIDSAISAAEDAYKVDKNELVLSNLGVFNLCAGNTKEASKYFNEAIIQAPDSYLGYEMLGTALFFSQDFQQSLSSKLKAMELSGESNVHQIWGSLADGYLYTNNLPLAAESYGRALEIIEVDIARGNITPADKAHQIYYLHKLATLQSDNSALTELAVKQLQSATYLLSQIDGPASIKLSVVYYEMGQLEKANLYFQNAVKYCPMYSKHPSIKGLVEQMPDAIAVL